MKEQSFFIWRYRAQRRDKLRKKQKLYTYWKYTKNLTSVKVNIQMGAESNIWCMRISSFTEGSPKMIRNCWTAPGNRLLLAKLAEKLLDRFEKDLTVMGYETLMTGHDHFCSFPPARKSKQISMEVENLIVKMALENLGWMLHDGSIWITTAKDEPSVQYVPRERLDEQSLKFTV